MPPAQDPAGLIAKFVEWSNIARKQGLLGLEPMIDGEMDPFVRKGLQLVVDGSEPDQIRSIMEVELSVREHADQAGAQACSRAWASTRRRWASSAPCSG